MAKKKYLTSPEGKAVYPWLNTPDTKFNKGGEFKVTLELSEIDAEDITHLINEAIETEYTEQLEKAKPQDKKKIVKQFPYENVCDDTGEETGDVGFKFKMNHTIVTKKDETFKQSPDLFDKYGTTVTDNIYGGSRVKCAYELVPYFIGKDKAVGCSLRLRAVQVLELVSGSGGSADAFGFETEALPEAAEVAEAADDSEGESDDF